MNTGTLSKCPSCGISLKVDVFPAYYSNQNQSQVASPIQGQGSAECFNHPGKQAIVPCSVCGRLLCALCEIEFEGKSLCIQCLQSGKKKKKISSLENKRFLFDNLAIALAFWPMLFVFPTLVTAPAVLFLTFRYWKQPGSIVPRTRFRFVLAALLAVLQLIGWAVFFAGIFQ